MLGCVCLCVTSSVTSSNVLYICKLKTMAAACFVQYSIVKKTSQNNILVLIKAKYNNVTYTLTKQLLS